jgi:hypothetical protein
MIPKPPVSDNIEALRIKKKIVALKNKISKLNKQEMILFGELQKCCLHTETELKEYNFEGSYLNLAEYHKVTICSICGEELEHKTTFGGYG